MITIAMTMAIKSGTCERGAAGGGAAPGTGGRAMWWPCPRVQPKTRPSLVPYSFQCVSRSSHRHLCRSLVVAAPPQKPSRRSG